MAFPRVAGQRAAGYVRATESSKAFDDPGIFVELPLVNKIRPRVDDSRLGKNFKARLYHIYADPEVKEDINRKVEPHVPLPDLVHTAYTILGSDWDETRKRWEKENAPTPPVAGPLLQSLVRLLTFTNEFINLEVRVARQRFSKPLQILSAQAPLLMFSSVAPSSSTIQKAIVDCGGTVPGRLEIRLPPDPRDR
jgi:hypothetical protein